MPTEHRDSRSCTTFRASRLDRLTRVLTLAGFALLPVITGCQFLDTPTRLSDGFYAGAVAGASLEQFDLPSGLDSETGATFGLRGGYRFFHHRAALEFSYEELVVVDLELDTPRLDVGEFSGRTFMAQLKGYANDAPIQGYGLVGVGLIDAEIKDNLGVGLAADESELAIKLGGGMEVHTGAHWTFFVEGAWTHPTDELDDFDFITVLGGVNYRF